MKVLTFGELMMRLMVPNNFRFKQAKSFEVSYAGSEASVAVSLSNYGIDAGFITVLPNNDFGKTACSYMQFHGVDTSKILFHDGRMGLYFVESGFSNRATKVVYDRANSVISQIKIDDIKWDEVFEDYDWFHFSGITPALSDELVYICEVALKEAKKQNIIVSCDLNYRGKLWSESKASNLMQKYMSYIDILIGNEEDAKIIFGLKYENSNSDKVDLEEYKLIMNDIKKRYKFDKIYFTLRESIDASHNFWSSIGYDGNGYFVSSKYDINILDRLGAGDSFSAGVIFGEINGLNVQETIEFATAASCLKHTIREDFNIVTKEEVFDFLNNNNHGRIKR